MNNYKNYIIVGLLVVITILVLVFMPKRHENPNLNMGPGDGNSDVTVEVNDFLSCAEAGYPIMESYPRQCRDESTGKTYVEDISEDAEVVIETPTRGQLVNSPLTVKGKAKGNWFFEANIPVTLKDQNGKILAQKGAQAEGNWMTTEYVNFTVVLEFAEPTTEFGVLLIQKDNPSGMPENDNDYPVSIKFK